MSRKKPLNERSRKGLSPAVTIRGNAEGFAAVRKRPSAVLSGQIAYLGTLVAVLAATLHFGLPGWLMGVTAILSATVATTVAVRAHLAVTRAANSALAGRR